VISAHLSQLAEQVKVAFFSLQRNIVEKTALHRSRFDVINMYLSELSLQLKVLYLESGLYVLTC